MKRPKKCRSIKMRRIEISNCVFFFFFLNKALKISVHPCAIMEHLIINSTLEIDNVLSVFRWKIKY